ncbi:hypothetical protein LTR82_018195 [Friedmanniomyces endolithicus]|uniref:Uncharacterized protein n=1 Tax=Friedmanniomyces endolithicus TaxID=329885 RepID=A0AAN6F2R2_9PEZI|nr:hypothetical protein LTR82_018195 [Friedmanniomyces endolithicus]
MDARSTFIAASEDETHDTQELVGLWQTAAFEFDEAFRHDISRDGFTAAHGSVSGTTSAPHTDAKDKRKVELRTGGVLDCRSPRPAGVDTDDQGSICPAPRDRLDVEGAGGLLVAGSGLRPDSAQPFCRCDKIPSSAPSHPQSIAAATADDRLQKTLLVDSIIRATLPLCSRAIRWDWVAMRQGLILSMVVSSLRSRMIHTELPARSIRPPAQRLMAVTMKIAPTSQGDGVGSLNAVLPAYLMAARVMQPAGQIRLSRRYPIRLLVSRRMVRLPIYNVAGRLDVDA